MYKLTCAQDCTILLAAQARKIPCMQIGPLIEKLMAAEGLTYENVAARVRAQGAAHVKYQHIQQLVQFPNRRPKYILELARAFGFTVEEFMGLAAASNRISEPRALYTPASLPVRSRLATMEDAVALLRRMVAARDWPNTALTDPFLLWIAQETVAAFTERLNEDNVIDFMQRFNTKLKAQGGNDSDERRSDRQTGEPDADTHQSARKSAR